MELSIREVVETALPEQGPTAGLPHFLSPISAGFPSPAEDYIDTKLDLNDLLVRHPATTFLVTVKGDSMRDANICTGDILVVDRSLQPNHNRIVIAALDGELVVKRLRIRAGRVFLVPENPAYETAEVTTAIDFKIWGVVTAIIHKT
jgi:DNA polymerase V